MENKLTVGLRIRNRKVRSDFEEILSRFPEFSLLEFASKKPYDLLIRNLRVVRPQGNVVHEADIAIKDGKFARVAPGIDPGLAKSVHEGKGLLAFPGVVDAHMHSGI